MIYNVETSETFASLLKLNSRHCARKGLEGASASQDNAYKAMMKNFDK